MLGAAPSHSHFTEQKHPHSDFFISYSEVNGVGICEEFAVIPTPPNDNKLRGSLGRTAHFNRPSRVWLRSVSFLLALVATLHILRWLTFFSACRDAYSSARASEMARRRKAGSERTMGAPEGYDLAGNCLYLDQEYGCGLSGDFVVLKTDPENAKEELLPMLNPIAVACESEPESIESMLACHHSVLTATDVEGLNQDGHIAGLRAGCGDGDVSHTLPEATGDVGQSGAWPPLVLHAWIEDIPSVFSDHHYLGQSQTEPTPEAESGEEAASPSSGILRVLPGEVSGFVRPVGHGLHP